MEYFLFDENRFSPKDYRLLFSLCPPERQRQVKAMGKETDRRLAVLAGALPPLLLANALGVSPAFLSFVYGKNGKPYLKGNALYFSLSHSRAEKTGALLLAISPFPVGCDLQAAKLPSKALRERVCSPQEREYLEKSGGEEPALRFARIWAAKEAYLKYTGEGLGGRFSSPEGLAAVESCRGQALCRTFANIFLHHATAALPPDASDKAVFAMAFAGPDPSLSRQTLSDAALRKLFA